METFKYNGLVITKNPLYYGLVIFSISYNPKPIDEVHHFSRWLKPHHQPVEFMNHFVSAGLTFNLDTSRPIQETFSPWLWHMTRDMLRCSSTFCFFLSEFFFFKWTNKQMNLFNAGSEDWFHQTYSLATQQTNLFRIWYQESLWSVSSPIISGIIAYIKYI